MKAVLFATLVSLATVMSLSAQKPADFISVTFAVDGKPVICSSLKVVLYLAGKPIFPKSTDHGFTIPAAFNQRSPASPSGEKVDVSVSCGEQVLSFPKLHPSWISAGHWELGIVYPPYAIERFRRTRALEQGAWISYLESECNGCDPGVVTMIPHPDPPAPLLASLHREQLQASGERARDIAYELAVFRFEYQNNRNHLVDLLNTCLLRPRESPEDDVCDGKLLDYMTNLYWRGDDGLLEILLQVADSRRDVIFEVGTFYADLLDRHTEAALQGMRVLPIATQAVVCRLAGEDDFSIDAPKLKRVTDHLHAVGGEVADRCLQEAEKGAGRVAQ